MSGETLKDSRWRETQRRFGESLKGIREQNNQEAGTWAIILGMEPMDYVGLESGEGPVPDYGQILHWAKALGFDQEGKDRLLMAARFLPANINPVELSPYSFRDAVNESVTISREATQVSLYGCFKEVVGILRDWTRKRKFRKI